jgi:hypothetical protein
MANTTINVIVAKKKPVVVSTNEVGGIINTATPVTLKNVPTIISGGSNSFDTLDDVNLSQRTDGSVPIYDQPTNTYVVKHLNFTEVDGNLDGGVF